VISQSN